MNIDANEILRAMSYLQPYVKEAGRKAKHPVHLYAALRNLTMIERESMLLSIDVKKREAARSQLLKVDADLDNLFNQAAEETKQDLD